MIPKSEIPARPVGGRNPQYDDMIRFGREGLGLPESIPIELAPLEGRGSDRTFHRLRWKPNHSAILIAYDPIRLENAYYADLALFLRGIDVPVPKVLRHDPDLCLIVMEDLGDRDLWSFRNAPWKKRRRLYQKSLSIIHRLHSLPEEKFPFGEVRLREGFGPDLYHWEQQYFKDHFIRDICGLELEPSFEKELDAELSALAGRIQETKRSLIHRDFQSQNIMVRDGNPYLIDFQGMRLGSPFYDLASLLCDPYVEWREEERIDLLLFYYRLSEQELNWEVFQRRFWEASAQRLMQALGAFGFLGLKKGLKGFLKHIPRGVQHLHLSALRSSSLPSLLELSMRSQSILAQKGDLS